MGIRALITGEAIEIVEWPDDPGDTLSWRFPGRTLKNGARLVVREAQHAQFVYGGQFADAFAPGTYRLTTDNIPVLTRLASWPYGFDSPFKADVYFVVTRLFTGNPWGTANPVLVRDPDLGPVRLRAFGTYDFRVVQPATFLREVAGFDDAFERGAFADALRSRLVSIVSDALASSRIPVMEMASRYTELGEALLPLINPVVTAKYGLEIGSFVVENVSLPPEVERAVDARASMSAIGNLQDFVRYQMAQGLGDGAAGGAAVTAAHLAMGVGLVQPFATELAPRPGAPALPELLTPLQVAEALGVDEADVRAVLVAGDLKGTRIGTAWRVTREALAAYLSR